MNSKNFGINASSQFEILKKEINLKISLELFLNSCKQKKKWNRKESDDVKVLLDYLKNCDNLGKKEDVQPTTEFFTKNNKKIDSKEIFKKFYDKKNEKLMKLFKEEIENQEMVIKHIKNPASILKLTETEDFEEEIEENEIYEENISDVLYLDEEQNEIIENEENETIENEINETEPKRSLGFEFNLIESQQCNMGKRKGKRKFIIINENYNQEEDNKKKLKNN
jgi:hypothetical protein